MASSLSSTRGAALRTLSQGGRRSSMSPKKGTEKSAKSTTAIGKAVKGFTDEERAAMKERVQELKAEARRGPRAKQADGESDVLAKIAEMPKPDRGMAEARTSSRRGTRRLASATRRIWTKAPCGR